MHMTTGLATLLVLQCCDLCLTIRVPVVWDHGEVQKVSNEEEFSVDTFKPQNEKQIPGEYFEYPAKKPQFAVDIAASHGVKSPENHYKAYPIRPHTGLQPPQLGIHQRLNEDKQIFQPLQKYVKEEGQRHVIPASSSYEIFHPYKAEEPALQNLYKDPVLSKIRNDLENNNNRLQKYENEAANADVTQDEYLESPRETDKKFLPQKNVPAEFEIYRPQRQPIYYRPATKFNHRENVLNQKLRHPWNQNFVKVRPAHYRPLKNHIHNLRQHHAMTYDDERNEYPQVQVSQNIAEPQDGYDIYERGKDKYVQLRNNVDESINKAVQENRPTNNENLELQKEDTNNSEDEEEEENEFVPIKNYAQVRKTETFKHLPRAAALEDAETYEEIKNAPRLREAVKSKKAQTVYTEEGYEDSAYDHAGEQKHASDHEGHGGYLKQNEISEGKYKTPSFNGNYNENKGSEQRDQVLHGEEWKNDNKDNKEETEEEENAEYEQEQSVDASIYKGDPDEENNRNKRENDLKNDNESNLNLEYVNNNTNIQHEVDKRELNFDVPEIDLNLTFLSEQEILEIAKQKIEPKKDNIEEKYPYYFNNVKSISKHSPLRYAENLKLIPNKSKGGTEFYDSRSDYECPEIEDVDPLPDKLKNDENPTSKDVRENTDEKHKGEKGFDVAKEQPRLRGLGDKIDCFKAKYFGENPLDSPFFKEEIILSPEPVTAPNLAAYKLKHPIEQSIQESININGFDVATKLNNDSKTDIFVLLDKLRTEQGKISDEKRSQVLTDSKLEQQGNDFNDILNNIKNNTHVLVPNSHENISNILLDSERTSDINNLTYKEFHKTDNLTKYPVAHRSKRATPFIYEPYKIIRDGQVQDSKKTTTTSNISPLIKQMQSSRVVDRVTRANQEPGKPIKRYDSSRTYKDIGKNDRSKNSEKADGETFDSSFVDVNEDQRRGEPRYELRPLNHKPEYSPVNNKTSMSVEDYKAQIKHEKSNEKSGSQRPTPSRRNSRQRRPTVRPDFDVSKFLPSTTEVQNVAASNTVRKTIATTTLIPDRKLSLSEPVDSLEQSESEEDDEEYEDDEEDEEITTTTQKPTRKKRIKITTDRPPEEKSTTSEIPKLRLVTRFRDYHPTREVETKDTSTEKVNNLNNNKVNKEDDNTDSPKYREKKKKSTKSTLVTDTKKYGDDDDDGDSNMRKEEVDSLIGVKHKMDDYIPMYEKERNKHIHSHERSSEEFDEDYDNDQNDDDDDSDDDEDEVDDDDEDDDDEEDDSEPEVTTAEPTKRTLPRTTDAPVPTVASRSTKLEPKPVISKKKIEIHKELPINNSSPHVTQFKQDIKEVEIIKEIPPVPKNILQKNKEALELYKDDNLAIDINNLSDVEIFKDNLDLKNGPRHGGNYRMYIEEPITTTPTSVNKTPKDAEASQSENTKHIELNDYTPKRMHGGNFRSLTDISRSRNSGRNSKYIEFSETEKPLKAMHGGNLRFDSKTRRGGRRNEKLIELDDRRNSDGDSSTESNYKSYSSRSGQAMHGGNYRSGKLIQGDDKNNENEHDIRAKPDKVKDPRRNAAVLLNSFAQVVPILTTTPGYILDPSKRMYYYVET